MDTRARRGPMVMARVTDYHQDRHRVLKAREALNRPGYLWSPPGQLPSIVWIAGIPSLTTYVRDHARPRHGEANAETPSRARDSAGTATAPITRQGLGDGDHHGDGSGCGSWTTSVQVLLPGRVTAPCHGSVPSDTL